MPVGLGNESKGWKLMTSGTRRTAPIPPADLQPLNRSGALVAGKELGSVSNDAPKSTEAVPHSSTTRKQWVAAEGNCLLWRVDVPIC